MTDVAPTPEKRPTLLSGCRWLDLPTREDARGALSFAEVAALLTVELRRPICYEPAGALEYIRHLVRARLPLTQAMVQAMLHFGLRFGQAATVDNTLEQFLGDPPRTMTDYIRDRRALWLSGRHTIMIDKTASDRMTNVTKGS